MKIILFLLFVSVFSLTYGQSSTTREYSVKGPKQVSISFSKHESSPHDSLLMNVSFCRRDRIGISKGKRLLLNGGTISFANAEKIKESDIKEVYSGLVMYYYCVSYSCSQEDIQRLSKIQVMDAVIEFDAGDSYNLKIKPDSFSKVVSKCYQDLFMLLSQEQSQSVSSQEQSQSVSSQEQSQSVSFVVDKPTLADDWIYLPSLTFPINGFQNPFELSWYCSNKAENFLSKFARNETIGLCLMTAGALGYGIGSSVSDEIAAAGIVAIVAGAVCQVVGVYQLAYHFKWNYRKKQVDFYLSPASATLKF